MSFWKGDAIATGMELATQQLIHARQTEREVDEHNKLVTTIEVLRNFNSGNLAEKQALREALRKTQPNHPLLTNVALQEKIKAAGQRAFGITNDWDSAREAGATFKI